MQFSLNRYMTGSSIVHRLDARVKLVLLLAYSVTLFFLHTWTGLLAAAAVCVGVSVVAEVPFGKLLRLLIPLYVILIVTLIFNSFSFDVTQTALSYGVGNVSAGVFASFDPVPLIADFGFVPVGFVQGMYYVLRVVFLVLASLVVSFTTTSTALIDALNDFLRPLRVLRVPTDDIAMIISIAIRFIPVTAEELFRIQAAQKSRGAIFEEGGIIRRIKAWQPVLIPLFVSLFRRANNLAHAMEARCYGMSDCRTRLFPRDFTLSSAGVLTVGLALCVGAAVFL